LEDLRRLRMFAEPVQDRAEIDVGPRPHRIEADHFGKVVGGAVEIVEQETGGRQPVVDVGRIRLEAEGLQIELPGLIDLALRDRLPGRLAKALDAISSHDGISDMVETAGRASGASSRRLYSRRAPRLNRNSCNVG